MGNTSGSSSGSASQMSGSQQAGMQMGAGLLQSGGQQNEAMLNNLARMGPPPQIQTTAPPPTAGQDIVGKYGTNMRPPSVNYRSRQDAQMNPSVGQLLTGAA